MTRRTTSTIALLAVVLLSGCGLFRAQQKAYFSIDSIPAAAPVGGVTGAPVGLDSFQLPPAIERREIAVRQENGELELRGRELWGATLDSLVMHALAFDLASRLPEGMVILPGQARPLGGMRSIRVVAETFEAGPEERVVLDARWVIAPQDASTPGVQHHERVEVPLDSLDSAEIAAGMSAALAQLADRIASQL